METEIIQMWGHRGESGISPRFKRGSGSSSPCGIAGPSKSIIALGVFDGVHRGHREIFRQVIARARAVGGAGVAYTFDPHPVCVLAPSLAPPMINTVAQRTELILSTGMDRVVVERFTKPFSRQTPEQFFKKVIVRRLKARELFAGYNFTFGVRRSGTIEHLDAFGRKAGIAVHILQPFLWKETLVSSTQVRQFLASGRLPEAEALLARPYFLEGKVVRGRGIGGKELGIHTANLSSENDAILPTGVYVTYVLLGGKRFRSVTNIGHNPTFSPRLPRALRGRLHPAWPVEETSPLVGEDVPKGQEGRAATRAPTIETHVLDGFHKNIIGKKLRVEFLKKIREEIRFNTPQDLAGQIRKDIQTAQKVFLERG